MSIESPCSKKCCLDQHDICCGCFRHIDEITGWHHKSDSEQLEIVTRCNQRQRAKARLIYKAVK